MPIIKRKISVPGLPADYCPRPRVSEIISQTVMSHRVTHVSAMAGSGKTTAVVEALHGCQHPLAWVSLDASDQSTGRLLAYMESALLQHTTETQGVLAAWLSAPLPHSEVAGLLAEAFRDSGIILVLDNLERLQRSPDAWEVIDSFVRYAPDDLHIVLIGREPQASYRLGLPPTVPVGHIGPETLAVTVDEATAMFERLERSPLDVDRRVKSVSGWVSGVLFAPDSFDPTAFTGSDPLHAFLSGHIMYGLTQRDQEFLVKTSVLSEVDARRAEALGVTDASARMESLSQLHLPAFWDTHHRLLRVHAEFREYLQDAFTRMPPEEQHRVHHAHARLLASEGDYEGAVEEYYRAGATQEAIELAREHIEDILDRGDIPLAEEWLHRWSQEEKPENPTAFSVAQLAVAAANDTINEALEIAARIEKAGALDQFVRASDRAAELLGWVYSSAGQTGTMERVIRVARQTPAIDALRYALSLMTPGPPAPRPGRSNGPLDVFTFRCDYYLGRLTDFARTESRLVELLMGPYRIALKRVQGRTEAALDAYRNYSTQIGKIQLHSIIGPELLMDAGLLVEAEDALGKGFELAEASCNFFYMRANLIVQAKLASRYRRNPARAKFFLAQGETLPRFAYLDEIADLWLGFALLMEQENEAAAVCLRDVVSRMQTNDHLLDLSTACIYLAEAEWRLNNPDASDQAAEAAVQCAKAIGTNHLLLQALTDFPAVLTRRLDAQEFADSEWHALSRALSMQRLSVPHGHAIPTAFLFDFGPPRLRIRNEFVHPRLMKTYELLAFLTTQPNAQATRDRLLDTLFPDKDTPQARTYLRQVLKWLRLILPDGHLIVDTDYIALDPYKVISTESSRFERLAIESLRLQGSARIEAMREALSIMDAGTYLAPLDSEWIEDRRARLSEIALDLKFALAKHLLEADRALEANMLLEDALRSDPLREEGWRLRMRIDSEFHDIDGVIRAFNSCREALARIETGPSASTRKLLQDLTTQSIRT